MNVRVQDMVVGTGSCNKGLSIWPNASEPRMERLKVEREHENAWRTWGTSSSPTSGAEENGCLGSPCDAQPLANSPALRPLHTRHHPPHDTLSHFLIMLFALPPFGAISRSYRLTER